VPATFPAMESLWRKLERVRNPDLIVGERLLDVLLTILIRDNRRRGELGLDCNDQPMRKTFREERFARSASRLKSATATKRQAESRLKQAMRARNKSAVRLNDAMAGLMDATGKRSRAKLRMQKARVVFRNTGKEKRLATWGAAQATMAHGRAYGWHQSAASKGSGPPLAPFRQQSRSIDNFTPAPHERIGDREWKVSAYWDESLSLPSAHKHILLCHRKGIRRRDGVVVRDIISHPTPTAHEAAAKAIVSFCQRFRF
jgi:hypothetical protein